MKGVIRQWYVICFIIINGFLFSETNGQGDTPVIAVLDFEPKSGITADVSDFVTERVRIELFKTRKYRIVERSDMEKILEEQKLELSGLTGSEYAAKVGKLLSARKILLGTVSKLENSIYINARVIDVETGVMEFGDTAEAESVSRISDASKEIVDGMTGINRIAEESIEQKPSVNSSASKGKKDLGSDISTFVNSTVDYFINRINTGGFSDLGSKFPSLISNDKNTNANSSSVNSKSADQVNEDDNIDEYVDRVKQNRDNYDSKRDIKGKAPASTRDALQEHLDAPKKTSQNADGEGGMGGPLIKYGFKQIDIPEYEISGNFLFVGGRGLWMVNRFFGIGGGGYGGILLNNPSTNYSLSMGYGGPILDFYYRIDKVRFDINCLIGGGGFSINKELHIDFSNPDSYNNWKPFSKTGAFFVFEPTLLIAFRVTSFMEIGITGSWLYTSKSQGYDFVNYTAGLSFMFGTGG